MTVAYFGTEKLESETDLEAILTSYITGATDNILDGINDGFDPLGTFPKLGLIGPNV